MKGLVLAVGAMTAATAFAGRQPFERYQSIVDRQMFGVLPEGFDPAKPPSEVQKTTAKTQKELTKEQEQIKKSVRFSMININPKGETMVGFTDSSDPKNVRNYYLRVGETRDGWTVRAADAVAATVSISKDGVDLDLELGGSSNGGGKGAASAPASAASRGGAVAPRRPGAVNGGGAPGLASGGFGSLRERLMARRQLKEENAAAEQAKKDKREAEQKEREAREAEDKAQRDQEREQQRQQLLQLQEELKEEREARKAREAEKQEKQNDDSNATSDE